MKEIKNSIIDSINVKKELLNQESTIYSLKEIINKIIDVYRNGQKVLICGNGGSAADAQHIAAELTGRFYFDRKPLDAESLNTNNSHITAVGNDYSFNDIYSRLVEAKGKKGDVLIGLSTSGNSSNVISAFKKGNEIGMYTFALTGKNGGELKKISNITITTPSNDTPRIQETHILIGHIICEQVEKNLFSEI